MNFHFQNQGQGNSVWISNKKKSAAAVYESYSQKFVVVCCVELNQISRFCLTEELLRLQRWIIDEICVLLMCCTGKIPSWPSSHEAWGMSTIYQVSCNTEFTHWCVGRWLVASHRLLHCWTQGLAACFLTVYILCGLCASYMHCS